MRIIHTSDWHLGQYFYGKSRANEHQQFLTWLLAQVTTHNIDAIIVAGDIFDTSTPPSYAREMYFDFIAKLHLTQCQLVILAGNHDSVAMLSESQAVLASLSTRVITQVIPASIGEGDLESTLGSTALNQQVFPLYNANGQPSAILCAIPFVRPRDVIKSRAGQSAKDKQQSLQQAISDHYQYLYQHALSLSKKLSKQIAKKQELDEDEQLPIIATGHLTALGVSVSDSKSDSVRDIYIGSLEAFPASAFPPADYIALGHIHRAQQVAKSDHIRYCGSPIPLSFDEAKQDKRVLMVDFTSGKLNQVEDLIVPCFQPLYMVKTSVDELESSLKETLTEFELFKEKQAKTDDSTELTAAISAGSALNIKAWLDIEIDNGDHLSDLSQRVSELAADMPFEVLLVRRCKKARQRRQAQLSQQDNSTLSELSLAEVFDSRLSQLDWQTDEEVARKTRLKQLFTEISVALADEKKPANLPAEQSIETIKIKEADLSVNTEEVGQENL
ncbi:exonuclease subunit SbcD [Colwellia sp. 75C3]|uniref:exonuclease subunit SbcD n=1 Tax=Colwellia sp. 75C3 TaxID=888425 RepID=UPI000C34BADC|nr:exonuclease subunit SbcD [Colwellia sp. 75C3]PKG82884.1 exonuclease subunit SbcD [Colwellia sp. 75C3]